MGNPSAVATTGVTAGNLMTWAVSSKPEQTFYRLLRRTNPRRFQQILQASLPFLRFALRMARCPALDPIIPGDVRRTRLGVGTLPGLTKGPGPKPLSWGAMAMGHGGESINPMIIRAIRSPPAFRA